MLFQDRFPTSEVEYGEEVRRVLVEEFGHETEAWATEQVTRVMARLERVRSACAVPGACPYPLQTEILWIGPTTAFAVPGRYVYLSRTLLERFDTDAPVALVLAHELAHHDLGHLRLVWNWVERLPSGATQMVAGALWQHLQHFTFGIERERAADAYALDLCLAAGYDGNECLLLFDLLERHSLDMRDIDGVYGPDQVPGESEWKTTLRRWTYERHRSHPALRERRDNLRRRLREYGN